MKVNVLVNIHSNIIEQKMDIATMLSIGSYPLGPVVGQYRQLAEYEVQQKDLNGLMKEIAKIPLQTFADTITKAWDVGPVVLLPAIITERGILVNYSRTDVIMKKDKRYVSDGNEARSLFLKLEFGK